MKKTVTIEDKGRYIYFKNRKIRTPVTLHVTESELKQLKLRMRMSDVQSYKVNDFKEEETEVIDYDFNEPNETVVEELIDEKEPKSLLEKYMRDGDGK